MMSSSGSTPETPYHDFQAGVTATLRSWSALKTAVEQEWGGSDSAAKAEDLRHNIFTFFDGSSPNPKMKLEELEDNLLGFMEDEFGVVLEDRSEIEVADLIWCMYEKCAKGDSTLAREVIAKAIQAEEALKQGNYQSVIKSGDDMEDSEDEGDAPMKISQDQMMLANADRSAASYASESLFGEPVTKRPEKDVPPPRQLGEAEPEAPKAEVDDDGFTMVATRKKKGR
mmetsp:Transcript_18993/g.44490  ORF Transcript_18993/g.44490 Transcript_18993/m.44490 type:complete len:227 (-) Transcript_18993:54-734(-)